MIRHIQSLFILLLAAFALSSCDRKVSVVLDDVESYIQARPDSALSVIRSIDTTSLKTRRARAQYSLLHAMALDKNWIDTTDINVVMPAIKYYDRHKSSIRRAKAWYYLGRIQQNEGNISESAVSFLKAEKIAAPFKDDSFNTLVAQAISCIYNKTYFNDDALKYTELAYSYAIAAGDTVNAANALYLMALDLNNVGEYRKSDSLYRFLINNNSFRPKQRASLLSNYALNLVTRENRFDEAVTYFEEVILEYGSLSQLNFWGAYAYALVRTGKAEKACKIFDQMEKERGSSAEYVYSYWKSLSEAYSGSYRLAYQLSKSASDIQMANLQKVLRQSAIKAQKEFLEQEVSEANKVSKQRQLLALCVVCFLLFAVFISILLSRRRSLQSLQEREAILETYRELTGKVDQLTTDKAEIRRKYICTCQSYFGQIGRINEMLATHSIESDNTLYQVLKNSIQQIGKDDKCQKEFEKMVDDSFDNLMTHFREAFPGRKERYYRLACYLFAGFDATTICTVLPDYNKHNVYVEKSRIKKMIIDSDSLYREQFLKILP